MTRPDLRELPDFEGFPVPPRSAPVPPVSIPSAELARIKDHYLHGRYRTAFELGSAHGPMRAWSGPAARLIAGRLALQLGAPRLGRQLHALAFRESPAYPEAVYYAARMKLERFGPYSAWRFARTQTDWDEASPEIRGDWFSLQAFVASRFRDFDRADKLLAQSEAISPDRPWHHVERSSVLEFQDRFDEALNSARRAHELHPWFRPAIQAIAHLLNRRGREAEALDFLREGADKIESGLILAQIAALETDLGQYAEAERSLDRFEELSPMLEPDVKEWLAARRADLAYHLGNIPRAIEQVGRAGAKEKFYPTFAENLKLSQARGVSAELPITPHPPRNAATSPTGGEVENPKPSTTSPPVGEVAVPSNRDSGWGVSKTSDVHNPTGAPATRAVLPLELPAREHPANALELLAKFWNEPLPPAPLNPGLVVDGLPDPTERERFEAAGWFAREFTFDLDSTAELIRRGVPFLATLFESGFGQPRLILGFDSLRESIYLVEPSDRRPVEAPRHLITERFGATGPRCLVLIPRGKADLIRSLALPDSTAYERLHALQLNLHNARFTEARIERDKLLREFPKSRLARYGELAWARGTAHPHLIAKAFDRLLELAPNEPTFVLGKSNALREMGRLALRNTLLREAAEREGADAIVVQTYAQGMLSDPVERPEIERLLRLSLEARPHAPAGYFLLSAVRWESGDFAEAVELNRIACCLEDREEQFAEAYVRAVRGTDKIGDAIRLLQQRVRRAPVPQPGAVRSLFHALQERGEPDFAWTALEKAIEKLSDLPAEAASLAELQLYKSEQLGNRGKWPEAEAALQAAQSRTTAVVWYKAAARIARLKPDFRKALEYLRSLLAIEPLNAEAQRLAVGLIQDTEGRPTARAYLFELVQRYPHFYPFLRAKAEFIATEPGEAPLQATRDLLDVCPDDAWAFRQLGLIYGDRRQIDEALAMIEKAGQYERDHPSYCAVRANILRRADRTEEALAAFQQGLAQNIDHELAIAEYVRTARGVKEKRAALEFVREQLHRQTTNGEGLQAYRDQYLPLIDEPEEQEKLTADLDEFLDLRPDLWQAWSLMIQQYAMAQRMDEAYTLARQAVEKFPLLARLWMDLAEASRLTGRSEERLEAIQKALGCAPGWTPAARELAEALAEQDDFDEAIAVLEQNLPRAPLDPLAHGFLAERLWNSDRGEEALRCVETAVRHEPGYDWAWQMVANWGERLDRPDAALALARELALDRGGDPRVFMKLARSLYRFEQTGEALAALDRAIALDPKNPDPHDLKAERLAEVGRFDEAVAGANPPELQDEMPLILQGRAAWVEARRGNFARAIPMMQALVSVDPGYYWGWSQLAEWYKESGKPEAYLEATGEMILLRPDHPTPLTLRGEAKLQNGDSDGGKEDLREALRIAPGYSPAAAILFDACLEDEEWKEARAALSVLQEHMTGSEVLVKQISYAVRTKDEEGAVRAFREICTAEGESAPGPIQQALYELREAGWETQALQTLAEAWQSGEPFNPWAALFWLDSSATEELELEDRLAACDSALRTNSHFVPAYDRKAEQLARHARFEEARAACEPISIRPTPLTLRGRAAWVAHLSGEKETAIRMIRACLEEDPDYTWAWRQLAHWYDEMGKHRECLTAAEELVRLAPHDPYAYGIRGEAKRILGDHRGAKEDYQLAFDLDPNFDAAGHQLMAAQLATDDINGATRTLSLMREHTEESEPLLQLRATQLAARQKNLAQARGAFRTMTTDPSIPRPLLRDAAQALDAEKWGSEADEEILGAIERADCSPATAAVWVERNLAADQAWRVGDRLQELMAKNPEAGREAALVYALGLAVTGQPKSAIATVQRFAETLRESDEGWARAGAVLAQAREFRLAIAWLSDWERREDCEPWMLRALADSHRAWGDDAKCVEILASAERLADEAEEPLPADFLAWRGLERALAGETTQALSYLDLIESPSEDPATHLVRTLGLALIQVATADDHSRAFKNARSEIRSAIRACPKLQIPIGLPRLYQKVVAQLSKNAGTVGSRFWSFWQRIRPDMSDN